MIPEPYPVLWAGQRAVVVLPDHMDVSNAAEVRSELLAVINRGATVMIADMSATVSCDHSGAEAVARAYQRAVVSGTDLRLVVTSQAVRHEITVSGLSWLVPVYHSLEQALASRKPAGRALTPVANVPARARVAAGPADSGHFARLVTEEGPAGPATPDPEVGTEIARGSAAAAQRRAEIPGRMAAGMNHLLVHRLFSAGLSLEVALEMLGDHPATGRIRDAVTDLDQAIRELRSFLFDQLPP
jgi:anti-anti-sigma factor